MRTPVSTHRSPNTINLYTIILFKSCPISFGIEDGKSRKEVRKEVTVELPGSLIADPGSGEFTGGRADTELLGKASASDGQPVLEKTTLDYWLLKILLSTLVVLSLISYGHPRDSILKRWTSHAF
jgi:hypothetical protein